MTNKKIFWLLLAVSALTLIPFLGYEFNTKGEPREAIVAMTMLDSGNWILPLNNGDEMPYKPMFFHWLIAVVSLFWGEVTEFSSRIPSAVALVALVATTFVFFARRGRRLQALVAAVIVLTCMEVHRAGGNCRVDMVLTALSVGASCLLYRWWERGMKQMPWLAIVLMSAGVLTKGPVGALIPCLVMGVFMLLKGVKFLRAPILMMAACLLSCVVPALWYVAAYMQGGEKFLDLVYEENIGRMTNTMGYDSCVEPWWYPTMTVVYGMVPFTLLILMGLLTESRLGKRLGSAFSREEGQNRFVSVCMRFYRWITGLKDVNLYALVACVIILVFYSIPQSKRSVYLMPMYPFLAWFIAAYVVKLAERGRRVVRVYGHFLAGVAVLLLLAFAALKLGLVPDSIFHGKHAAENIAMLHNLAEIEGLLPTFCIVFTTMTAVMWWAYYCRRNKQVTAQDAGYVLLLTIGIYLSVDGAYKPAALEAKSVKPIAAELQLNVLQPETEGVYEYIEAGEMAKGDPVHYFELNFFLHNRIQNFKRQQPAHGYLLIGEEDAAKRLPEFQQQGYVFKQHYATDRRVSGQPLRVYHFTRLTPQFPAALEE